MTASRILVVDDEADIRGLLKEILAEEGYEVEVAADATQARTSRATHVPDLVLLDLKMPKVDGFQVLAEMKSEPDLRSIPVIVMSSSSAEKDLVRAYDAQVSAYLVKPSNFDEYFNAIRAVKELWFHVVALPPKVRSAAN